MSERESTFGTVLRQFREASGLSQELLAQRAGLSLRGISDLERGRRSRPRLETVRMLADGLQLGDEDRAALLRARNMPAAAPSGTVGHVQRGWPALPAPATSLIGRESEIGEIMALLRDEAVHLVTLTGPGGVGKTRIAVETAHRLATEGFDGAVFIDLSPILDPALVIPAIASRLGVIEAPGRPVIDAIEVSLQDRSLLMVLDNLEQVVEAATEIADLLSRCPMLTILATSRIVLRVAAEQVFPIAPLPVPDQSMPTGLPILADVDAVALFVDRARMRDPAFSLTEENSVDVAHLVTRLDGLPLAIELAAARTRTFTPQMLLERLKLGLPVLSGGARDAPERQRTMRDAIAWSYSLLPQDHQVLFRRLSIFVRGCTLHTAETLVGAGSHMEPADIADGLESLVNNCLLQRRDDPSLGARYVMLQTIREFGLEQLSLHGEEQDVRDIAHRTWSMDLARAGEWLMTRSDQVVWMKRFDAELANLSDHLTWLVGQGRIVDALELSGSLWFFLWIRGHYAIAREQWEALLVHPGTPGRTIARGRVLVAVGVVSAHQGDTERSLEVLHEAQGIFKELGDQRYLALALLCEGTTHAFRSDFDRHQVVCEACMTVAEHAGDEHLVQAALVGVAIASANRGNMVQYRRMMQSATDSTRALAWPWGQSIAEANLGLALAYDGELDAAEEHLQSAARITSELGSKRDLPLSYLNLADVAQRRGDMEKAAELTEHALQASRDMGESRAIAFSLAYLAEFARKAGNLERALALVEEARETFLQIGDEFSAMTNLELVAHIAMDLGEPERAAWYLGVVDAALERHGVARRNPDVEYTALVADVVAAIGEPGWRKHWMAGHLANEGASLELSFAAGREGESMG